MNLNLIARLLSVTVSKKMTCSLCVATKQTAVKSWTEGNSNYRDLIIKHGKSKAHERAVEIDALRKQTTSASEILEPVSCSLLDFATIIVISFNDSF